MRGDGSAIFYFSLLLLGLGYPGFIMAAIETNGAATRGLLVVFGFGLVGHLIALGKIASTYLSWGE